MTNKQKQFNVVAGFNRGGTSCLMSAIRECGIPIIGFEFPWSFEVDYARVPEKEGEEFKIVQKGVKKDGGLLEPTKRTRRRNPTGYWEVPSICIDRGLHEEHLVLGNAGNVVKVPFNILSLSNPNLINKTVVILRNPAKVITSQKQGKMPEDADEKLFVKVGLLTMLHNAALSLKWLELAEKEYLVIYYEKLLEKPVNVLLRVCEFFGRGQPEYGAKIINKRHSHATPIGFECEELERVREFYDNPQSMEEEELAELRQEIKELDDGSLEMEWKRMSKYQY